MPQGPDGKTIIIVKKVVGHGGHHGGSWKVAYADFVTSMMAFFMVLWLVNSASVQTRERIASYFRAPGVFEKGSGTPAEIGGAGILPDTFAPPAEANSQIQPDKKIYEMKTTDGELREAYGDGGEQPLAESIREAAAAVAESAAAAAALEQAQEEKKKFEELADELEKVIKAAGKDMVGKVGEVEVKVDQRGLHLEIMDTPTASMFARGSAGVLKEAEVQLKKMTDIIKTLPNPIDIEGHTDAAPFKGKAGQIYDNWNLSTDRANAARRVLLASGAEDRQIARVVGYAAQKPKVEADPFAAPNRRISISMRYTEQAAKALESMEAKETKSVPLKEGGSTPRVSITRPPGVPGIPTKAPPAVGLTQAPPSQGDPTKMGTIVDHGAHKGLTVEVTTTAPEGTIIQQEVPTYSGPREPWQEKDKIFGQENPFD